jgi:alkylhydroperoxidase family enzyme
MPRTSWITGDATTRDELLDLRPELANDHRVILESIWQGPVRARTLELCRLRMATLLAADVALQERTPEAMNDGLDEATVQALPQWAIDDRFTEADRACINLAEQYVIDVHGVSDAMVSRVTDAVGSEGALTLTTAMAMWELTHRFDNALLATHPDSAPPTKETS